MTSKELWSTPVITSLSAARNAQSGTDMRANEAQVREVFPDVIFFDPSGPILKQV